jgi:phage terminase small subunit
MRGRKRTPSYLKVLRGNPSRRPMNKREPKPQPGVGAPPTVLGARAKAHWRYHAKHAPWLTRADRETLRNFCLLCAIIDALAESDPQGRLPKVILTSKALAAELGLTPTSRGKVEMPEPDKKDATAEKLFG